MSVFSAQTSLILVAKFFDHSRGRVVVYVVVLVLRILILGVLVLLLFGLLVVVGVPLVIVNFLVTSLSIKTQKIIRPTTSDSSALATAPQGLLKKMSFLLAYSVIKAWKG